MSSTTPIDDLDPFRSPKPLSVSRRQLEAITGATESTIHYYRRLGVLPPPNGGRRHARYDIRHVEILMAVMHNRRKPNIAMIAEDICAIHG